MTETFRETLTSLTEAFALDRELMDSCFPPIDDADRCRYCGGRWHRFASCRFDGHVRCAMSLPFQQRLVRFFDDHPNQTYESVAFALGVSKATVKAWWINVKAPRRGSRPRGMEPEVNDASET